MRAINKILLYIVLLGGATIFVVPMLWMLSTAVKPIDQAMSSPPQWMPYEWIWQNNDEQLSVGVAEMPEDVQADTPVQIDTAYQWRVVLDEEPVPVSINEPISTSSDTLASITANYHLYANIDGQWLLAKAENPESLLTSSEPVSIVVMDKEGYTFRKTVSPDDIKRTFDLTQDDVRTSFGETLQLEVSPDKLNKHYVKWDDRQELAHVLVESHTVEAGTLTKNISPRWQNFPKAITAMGHFGDYLRNTLVLCVLTVIGTVISSTLVAYGFSRINWPGRDKVFVFVLATMMIPGPVLMVPLFTMFKTFGWIGTLKPLWIPTFFAGAFNVFLLRQFFKTIPKDLSDSARIDGCNELRIFWQIVVPLAKPAITVVALFQFMATWNDFLGPLIYLTDQNDFTLALGLQFFQSQHGGTQWHYLMAASALVVLPIIVLFFLAQRTFIEGISMTGLKG